MLFTLTAQAQTKDPWLEYAVNEISAVYGDNVQVYTEIPKSLLKFGRNRAVGSSGYATLMTLPTGVDNETYVETNLIAYISSSSASDTEPLSIEGHTCDGSDKTFVVQAKTLAGQTKTALDTPLCRITRSYATGNTDLVGTIYFYQDDTVTAGVPQTDTKVHMMIPAGTNQTVKASTTISSTQYYLINEVYADILKKSAAFSSIVLEIRLPGKVFRQSVEVAANTGSRVEHEFRPYLIVPKNADVRIRAIADGASTDVSGGMQGIIVRIKE